LGVHAHLHRIITDAPNRVLHARRPAQTTQTTSDYDAGQDSPDCWADDCARAVTGTNLNLLPYQSRRDDCSRYQTTTVTPTTTSTTTVTTSTTITTTQYVSAAGVAKRKREHAPPHDPRNNKLRLVRRGAHHPDFASTTDGSHTLPFYAAGTCTPTTRYASACSCWGIFASTSTAAPYTTVVTATTTVYNEVSVTARQTVVSTTRAPAPTGPVTFILGVPSQNQYVQLAYYKPSNATRLQLVSGLAASAATRFQIVNGVLHAAGTGTANADIGYNDDNSLGVFLHTLPYGLAPQLVFRAGLSDDKAATGTLTYDTSGARKMLYTDSPPATPFLAFSVDGKEGPVVTLTFTVVAS
jgi:hypothetical protein